MKRKHPKPLAKDHRADAKPASKTKRGAKPKLKHPLAIFDPKKKKPKKSVPAKNMPPQPGDDKPVDPKKPKGPKWGELFGRKSKKMEGEKRPPFSKKTTKSSVPTARPSRAAAGKTTSKPIRGKGTKDSGATEPRPRKPRTIKEKPVWAVWVVFNVKAERVETFPYHDRNGAERCLAKKRGRRLKTGEYEGGTFYLNLVKES